MNEDATGGERQAPRSPPVGAKRNDRRYINHCPVATAAVTLLGGRGVPGRVRQLAPLSPEACLRASVPSSSAAHAP